MLKKIALFYMDADRYRYSSFVVSNSIVSGYFTRSYETLSCLRFPCYTDGELNKRKMNLATPSQSSHSEAFTLAPGNHGNLEFFSGRGIRSLVEITLRTFAGLSYKCGGSLQIVRV